MKKKREEKQTRRISQRFDMLYYFSTLNQNNQPNIFKKIKFWKQVKKKTVTFILGEKWRKKKPRKGNTKWENNQLATFLVFFYNFKWQQQNIYRHTEWTFLNTITTLNRKNIICQNLSPFLQQHLYVLNEKMNKIENKQMI